MGLQATGGPTRWTTMVSRSALSDRRLPADRSVQNGDHAGSASQIVVSGGSDVAVAAGSLATSRRPVMPAGTATVAPVTLTTQVKPGGRRNASTPSGASSHVIGPSPSAGWRRRSANAAWYIDSVDVGSDSWASAVSAFHSDGCGSHVAGPGPNPNGGSVPDHGSGTRHPSRPSSAPFVRRNAGSSRSSSGRSRTSGNPSSSPWYTYALPGRASISSVAARARRVP